MLYPSGNVNLYRCIFREFEKDFSGKPDLPIGVHKKSNQNILEEHIRYCVDCDVVCIFHGALSISTCATK